MTQLRLLTRIGATSVVLIGVVFIIAFVSRGLLAADTLASRSVSFRARLFSEFYFQGRIATSVKPTAKTVTFADHTIVLGQALAVLALEVQASPGHQDQQPGSLACIREILNGIDTLDKKAEPFYEPASPQLLDGFVLRDDIAGVVDERLHGQFDIVVSDWPHPNDNSPSLDQVFGLWHGLWCVTAYCGDHDIKAHAQAISARLFAYAQRNHFILRLPNGDKTCRGPDMRWLSSVANGMNKAITGQDHFSECKIELIHGIPLSPLNAIATFWSAPGTPQSVEDFIKEDKALPLPGYLPKENPFALHIILSALAPSEVWTQESFEGVALTCSHELSMAHYYKSHNITPPVAFRDRIESVLNKCPPSGPSSDLDVNTGWSHSDRWERCTRLGEKELVSGQVYNALDWLELYNIYRILYPQ